MFSDNMVTMGVVIDTLIWNSSILKDHLSMINLRVLVIFGGI